jgi:succinylglutamic semialdehyde dehydrogenase
MSDSAIMAADEASGPEFFSTDPCTGERVWEGRSATAEEVGRAVEAARAAQVDWARQPIERRRQVIENFAAQVAGSAELHKAICAETGKPRWEAKTEIESMRAKAAISIAAQEMRLAETTVSLGKRDGFAGGGGGEVVGGARFKPLGVVAVIGPFNFPGHLPNGQILPALLAGNAVVFKPSERTPMVGQIMHELWRAAGLPRGVLGIVQGAREVAQALARQRIDGMFFTGSEAAGRALHQLLAGRPEVLCALEMGGNNPLVFHDASDLDATAGLIVTSAFATAGQRCSCARRLILVQGDAAEKLREKLVERARAVRVGAPADEPEPWMGPVISESAAEGLLAAQARLAAAGGKVMVEMRQVRARKNFLCPGVIDVSEVRERPDEEYFGPLLQVIGVRSFEEAIAEANRTRFGLCAGLISNDATLREKFYREVRAGVIHFNRPLTGASSKLPFGGVGASGNHRPGAAFAVDSCVDPVAVVDG